jgi:alpha-1,4-glucan:alpha-1,4-glucan 6-glycosyltransferase/4-alpha-glucanotransferase
MDSPLLLELAAAHGIVASYDDIDGTRQVASDDALRATLRGLGVDLAHGDDLAAHVLSAQRDRWSRLTEPVCVAWDGRGQVRLRRAAGEPTAFALQITTEEGESLAEAGELEDTTLVDSATVDGTQYGEHAIELPALPLGYHHLLVTLGSRRAEGWIFSAPRRAWESTDRAFGVFSPLFSIYPERNHGLGHLGDLGNLLRDVEARGGSVVGTLPLLASFYEEPFDPSPYSPASRLAYNELYLDLAALPEMQGSPAARSAFDRALVRARIDGAQQADRVDYRRAAQFNREALEALTAIALTDEPTVAALRRFSAEFPLLDQYARFRATMARRGASWPAWPSTLLDGPLPDHALDPAVYERHRYAQMRLHEQLSDLRDRATTSLGLYLDLPVGVGGVSFDTWLHRDAFALGLSTGAPPDALFRGGQNWAFPPLHPERARADGYRYFIDVLRTHLRYAKVLRIDHVMGLHRLYVIGDGQDAKRGVYVNYRADELWAIVTLESTRASAMVVGEDLGTVPDAVREAMAEHGVSGMHVVQYEAQPDPDAALPPAPATSVASLNTHDMPPWAAYFTGADLAVAHDIGWLADDDVAAAETSRDALRAALRAFLGREAYLPPDADAAATMRAAHLHLARSEARVLLLSLADLAGATDSLNIPGTCDEHDNWSRRLPVPWTELLARPEVAEHVANVARARGLAASLVGEVRHEVSRLGEQDRYLQAEGTHTRLHETLGAHTMTVGGVAGTHFAVWAPSARFVSVLGPFNDWRVGAHPLVPRGDSGIWEGFIPGVGEGDLYKLHVAGPHGHGQDKADPLATMAEVPPRTASIVHTPRLSWTDAGWMATRDTKIRHDAPVSIYEVHLGSWMRVPEEGNRSLSYREIAPRLAAHVKHLGFSHVELLPVMEHPFYGSWGYQTTGYFAPTSRYGRPEDFGALVDHLHAEGIGVILDWVPSHFPDDAHGLAFFDGTHLYEHADPRQGFHPDWRSLIFNYGRHEVRSFLLSSAQMWMSRYHIDGLRVDAVASMLYLDYSRDEGEWIPNRYGGRENLEAIELLRTLNESVYRDNPGIQTFAEESTAWPMVSRPTHVGGLGFGYKWDMGWMHDTLQFMERDPIHRAYHLSELTFRGVYAFTESYVLALSHDEVVHGKGSLYDRMPGDHGQKLANMRLLYGYQWMSPGKKLLFMGQEFAQTQEWNHDRSLDWHLSDQPGHAGVMQWVADLNRLYQEVPALHELDHDPAGFSWIDFSDTANCVISFVRKDRRGRSVVAVCNLTPVPRHGYRIGLPQAGAWRERLNSDAGCYGGGSMGNFGQVMADEIPSHGYAQSAALTLPGLSIVVLQPEDGAP